MREAYHQPVGNPIQIDRLPAHRPRIVFSPHPSSVDGNPLMSLSRVMRWLAWLSLISMLGSVLWYPMVFSNSGPELFWLLWILAFVVLRVLRMAGLHEMPMGVVSILALGAFACWVLTPLPWLTHLLVYAVALALLVWWFGSHWIDLHLAWPTGTESAARLRRNWHGFLTLTAGVPLVSLFVFVLSDHVVPALLFPLVIVAFNLARHRNESPQPAVLVREAVAAWIERERHDARHSEGFVFLQGCFAQRFTATAAVCGLTSVSLVRLPLLWIISSDPGSAEQVTSLLFRCLPGYGFAITPLSLLLWMGATTFVLTIPMLTALLLPPLLLLPLLSEVRRAHVTEVRPTQWKNLVRQMQASVDPIERRSLYMGRLQSDGSPLLVPREVFHEHGHFLGDSGSGKTSMGLAPWLEQIITGDDCSVIVIDLKADSHELLATLSAAASERSRMTGRTVPVKHFSNQASLSSFAFNPLLQPFWQSMDPYVRTDLLCGALGLNYGSDYGEGYYSSANAAVIFQTIRSYPDTQTFRDLAERVRYVSANARKGGELSPEIGKAGVHVQTVLDRLGSFASLNVTAQSHSAEIIDAAIDFRDVFRTPQVQYFHLSSTLSPGASPEIARLVAYSLLAAATQAERRHQVFLVIDEFQRMVASSIEYMLQLARSMGVGVLIANQTMQDLKTSRRDLIPIIDANCRYRQWFGISSNEDRKRLIEASGETQDIEHSRSTSTSEKSTTDTSSQRQVTVNRFCVNDLLQATDRPGSSVVRISRGAGFAQFGGLPVIVESNYHISEAEFNRRKAFPWPESERGAFVAAADRAPAQNTPQAKRPPVTTEVIGDEPATSDPFESWHRDRENQSQQKRPGRRRSSKRRSQKQEN